MCSSSDGRQQWMPCRRIVIEKETINYVCTGCTHDRDSIQSAERENETPSKWQFAVIDKWVTNDSSNVRLLPRNSITLCALFPIIAIKWLIASIRNDNNHRNEEKTTNSSHIYTWFNSISHFLSFVFAVFSVVVVGVDLAVSHGGGRASGVFVCGSWNMIQIKITDRLNEYFRFFTICRLPPLFFAFVFVTLWEPCTYPFMRDEFTCLFHDNRRRWIEMAHVHGQCTEMHFCCSADWPRVGR